MPLALVIANHVLQFFLLPWALALLFCSATQLIFRARARRSRPFVARLLRSGLAASAASLLAVGAFNGASSMYYYLFILLALCVSEFYFLQLWKS